MALGNPAMGDDGAGPAALSLLRRRPLPRGVSLYNLESGSLGALALLRTDIPLILLDAVRGGGLPGTVYRLPARQVKLGITGAFSLHDLHLLHLAALFFPERLQAVTVLGVEPAYTGPGDSLSPQVKAALPLLATVAWKYARFLCGS